MEAALSGMRIYAAHRKGKQLWLELQYPGEPVCGSLLLHFGMTGDESFVMRLIEAAADRPFESSSVLMNEYS